LILNKIDIIVHKYEYMAIIMQDSWIDNLYHKLEEIIL